MSWDPSWVEDLSSLKDRPVVPLDLLDLVGHLDLEVVDLSFVRQVIMPLAGVPLVHLEVRVLASQESRVHLVDQGPLASFPEDHPVLVHAG